MLHSRNNYVEGEDRERFKRKPTMIPMSPAKSANLNEKPMSLFRFLFLFSISCKWIESMYISRLVAENWYNLFLSSTPCERDFQEPITTSYQSSSMRIRKGVAEWKQAVEQPWMIHRFQTSKLVPIIWDEVSESLRRELYPLFGLSCHARMSCKVN